jgi:hypothetical protein
VPGAAAKKTKVPRAARNAAAGYSYGAYRRCSMS